jgi:hypothetical protein
VNTPNECGCAYEVLPGGVHPERRYFHEPGCGGERVNTEPFARIRHALSHLAPGEDRFVARAARLGYEACAELEAEVVRLREERDRLTDLTRALLDGMGVELDDPRMGYIVAQLNRVDVEALREALAGVSE